MQSQHITTPTFVALVISIVATLAGLPTAHGQAPAGQATGLPDDWSHHHLVFSRPGSFADSVRSNTIENWNRTASDPRYQMQQAKRSRLQRQLTSAPDFAARMALIQGDDQRSNREKRRVTFVRPSMEKDWSAGLDGADEAATGTVGTLNSSSISGSSSITIGSTTLNASPPTSASAKGTFTGVPLSGQGVTITNGSNVLALSTGGPGSISFSGKPASGDTIQVGSVTYLIETSTASCGSSPCFEDPTGNQNALANLYAALTDNSANCGDPAPCFANISSANSSVLASLAPSTTTINLINATGSTVALATNDGHVQLTPATGGITTTASTNGCATGITSTPITGTFVSSASTTTLAANLAAAILACNTAYSALGVTATSAAGVVTVTAVTPGTGGNSIALGNTASNFSWSGATLKNGSDGTNSGTTFSYWSVNNYASAAQSAINVANAINANLTLQGPGGVTATANGNVVTVVARSTGTPSIALSAGSFSAYNWSTFSGGVAGTGTVQPNAYPAKYGFDTSATASCSDFVVFPTGKAGGASSASVVAYNNLYTSGCSGAVPSVAWAYNTGGTVTTSPVLSLDGAQVAFVQVSGTAASLVLLKWAASASQSVGSPQTLTAQTSAANYRSCTAPCFYPVSLGANDTFSAPFYVYNSEDAIYVGDDSGKLHKIAGVFSGSTIAEASGFPVTLNASNKVTSPIYDSNSGYVFVGDMGGVLYSVGSGNAGTTAGAIHGNTGSLGDAIIDAPLVDGTTGSVYVFVNPSTAGNDTVYRLSASFTTLGTPNSVSVGAGSKGYYLYSGNFDNVYYQSADSTGSMYLVGDTATTTGANLYRISISGGVLGAATQIVTGLTRSAANAFPWPSPATEFCNGACTVTGGATVTGIDYLFFSVNQGNKSGCTAGASNGCVLSYNISNPASVSEAGSGLNVATPGTNGCWATGGLVIDNMDSATPGASQIYFVNFNGSAAGGPTGATQTSSNCAAGSVTLNATQASQANP